MLTPQQLAHFEIFGFLCLRQLFSPAEIAAIRQEAETIWQTERQRRGLADDAYLTVAPFIERSPALLSLPADDRLYLALTDLLGPGFLWSGSEGNTGVAQANRFHAWHSDRPGEAEPDYRRVKVMIYLTSVTKETGCLRVIPGSHRLPLYRELDALNEQHDNTSERLFGVPGQDVPGFPLETTPGDVIFFNHYLYHGVYKGDGARRYIAMKFVSRPARPAHFASLKKFSPYVFQPESALVNNEHPRLQGLVNGLAELARQAEDLEPRQRNLS
ncbi:MAG: hypothetical protein DCC55_09765 [Chloroflexi bacterium]|nr:MAG: hypothetical protein DCC55_09765 [Chloroflexota bacterium]